MSDSSKLCRNMEHCFCHKTHFSSTRREQVILKGTYRIYTSTTITTENVISIRTGTTWKRWTHG